MTLSPRALARLFALPILALVTALGLMSFAPSAHAETAARKAQQSADIAIRQIGDPYRYGAAGPNAFDCSGLMFYSARRAGFGHMPRTSSAQARFTDRIKKSKLRRGDYMFFYDGGGVYHAAMFLKWNRAGRAVMVHSSRPGTPVQRSVTWTTRWFAGTLR